MKKVLCVCLGNTCRSPMMAALLQRELGDEFQVESAGTNRKAREGEEANIFSVLCMDSRGVNIFHHRSRFVGDLNLAEYSHVVCVDHFTADSVEDHASFDGADCIIIVPNQDGGGIPNPWQKGPIAYRTCAALLDKEMPKVAEQIRG